MEDCVAFVKPAGLRVDQVLQGTAGEGRGALGNLLLVEMAGSPGAVGIEQGGFSGDVYGGANCGDA